MVALAPRDVFRGLRLEIRLFSSLRISLNAEEGRQVAVPLLRLNPYRLKGVPLDDLDVLSLPALGPLVTLNWTFWPSCSERKPFDWMAV